MSHRLPRAEMNPDFGLLLDRGIGYQGQGVPFTDPVEVPVAVREDGPMHRGPEAPRTARGKGSE